MASTIRVNFVGDNRDLNKAIDDTNSKLGKVGDVGKTTALAMAGGFAAAGVALVGMAKAAAEDEKASTALAQTVKNVTGATDAQTKSLEDWITKQGKLFGVADDQLRPALDSLVRATGDVAKSQKLASLAMNISAGTGKDLTEVSDALSKAAAGNFKSLKALNPALNDLIKDGASTDEIFAALAQTFEGQAAKAADTTAGKLQIAKVQFSEMQEQIGAKVMPVLAALATFISEKVIPAIESFAGWLEKHRGVAIAAAVVIGTVFVAALIAWAAAAISAAAATIAAAAPVIAITVAIAALAAGVIYAYTHWGWFRAAVDGVVDVVKTAAVKIADFAQTLAGWVVDVWRFGGQVVEFFQGLPGKIADGMKLLADIITAPYRIAFNAIADLWNNTVGKLSFKAPDWIPGIGGKGWDVPDIPKFAQGGIVTSPTLALIGEAGPEAVVPLGRGGGLGMNITINMPPGSNGDDVVRAIRKYERRNGPGWRS